MNVLRCSLVVASLSLIAFATACSGDDPKLDREGGPLPDPSADGGAPNAGGTGSTAGAGDLVPYCAALKVVQDKCQRCHGDPLKNGAPVSFLSSDDFQEQYFNTNFKWWEVAADRVESDVMPFVALNDPPTNLKPPVEPLTPDEKTTLLGWLKQGALPEGGTDCP